MRPTLAQERQPVVAVRGYRDVDQILPRQSLPLTAAEATTAARLLYRQFVENKTKGYKLAGVEIGQATTVGLKDAKDVRPPWQWEDIIVVNPQKGWRDLIHRLSHKFHARLHSDATEHDERHVQLEAEMASWVVSHGWLDGKLR
jgi:hypothetical protein